MGAPPAPVVRKGAGMGMIAGLVVGALVLAVGGYFGYKKFFGPTEPGGQAAQVQPQETQTPPPSPPAEQPPEQMAQAQTPSEAGVAVTPPAPGYQAPAVTPSTRQAPPQSPGSGAARQAQTPAYAPPVQPPAPAYSPPVQQNEPAARPPAQQPAQPQQRSFPPAQVTPTPPQAAPPAQQAPAAARTARYTGPTSGMLMWLGKLNKDGVVTIEGNRASTGTLTGSLPGVPVTLETDLTNIGFAEMPGPSNGWKRVSLRSKKNQNIVISIRWKVLD